MLQCWPRTGHLPSFFVPTPGDFTAQESPPPEICHPRQKMIIPGGQLGGGGGEGGEGAGHSWNWLMHYVGGVTVAFFLVFHLSLWTHYTWSKFYMYLEQKYFRSWSLAFALTLMFFVWLWAFHLQFNNQPTFTHMAMTLMSCFDVTVNTKKMWLFPQCTGKMH